VPADEAITRSACQMRDRIDAISAVTRIRQARELNRGGATFSRSLPHVGAEHKHDIFPRISG